jgi:hypothetical protein
MTSHGNGHSEPSTCSCTSSVIYSPFSYHLYQNVSPFLTLKCINNPMWIALKFEVIWCVANKLYFPLIVFHLYVLEFHTIGLRETPTVSWREQGVLILDRSHKLKCKQVYGAWLMDMGLLSHQFQRWHLSVTNTKVRIQGHSTQLLSNVPKIFTTNIFYTDLEVLELQSCYFVMKFSTSIPRKQ